MDVIYLKLHVNKLCRRGGMSESGGEITDEKSDNDKKALKRVI